MAFKAFWTIPHFKPHLDKNEILSFHWGAAESSRNLESDPGRGVHEKDFTVVRAEDAASAKLFTACANGEEIPKITIFIAQLKGKTMKTYMTYNFETAYISTVRPGGRSDDLRLEEISVNYETVKFDYAKD